MDLTGDRRIQIFGADNPDALRGLYLDGAVFDEYGQMRPRVWSEVVRPALADREGWATFIGTPMGKNHFYDLYREGQSCSDWHTALYTVEDTGVLPDEELGSRQGNTWPQSNMRKSSSAASRAPSSAPTTARTSTPPGRRTGLPACRGSPRPLSTPLGTWV